MRTLVLRVAFGSAFVTLGACSYPITTFDDIKLTRAEPGLNGYYFLPRTLLTIRVTPKTVQGDSETVQLGAPAPRAPAGTTATPQTATAQPQERPQGGGDSSTGFLSFDEITLAKTVDADPAARLLYRFEPSAFSDDVLQVDTQENGLLSTVSSDTTDRSGDIAIAIAQLVFTVATKGAPLPQGLSETKEPFGATYDPFDPADVSKVRPELYRRGYCVLVGQEEIRAGTSQCSKTSAQIRAGTGLIGKASIAAPVVEYAEAFPGLYYRRPNPTPIEVYKDKKLIWRGSQPIFSKSDFYQITIDRTQFVQKQTTIKFTNGSLTSIKLSKPSEALAFVGIPVKIARIVFAIPLAGLQQETGLIDAQTKLANAQSNLINAQSALLKLQIQQSGQAIVATPVGH